MHKRPTPLNRIDAMEAQLRQMQAELRSLRKEPAGGTPHFVRIGKTTTDGEASYPSAPANTYGVVCQEATFTSTPGNQTPTVTDLSEAQQIVAHDLVDDRFIDEDTQVLVLRQPNGKNVLWPLAPPSPGATALILFGDVASAFTNHTYQDVVFEEMAAWQQDTGSPAYVRTSDDKGIVLKSAYRHSLQVGLQGTHNIPNDIDKHLALGLSIQLHCTTTGITFVFRNWITNADTDDHYPRGTTEHSLTAIHNPVMGSSTLTNHPGPYLVRVGYIQQGTDSGAGFSLFNKVSVSVISHPLTG